MLENRLGKQATLGSVGFQEYEGKELTDSLHVHESFELSFITRGSGDWQIGATRGRFRAGSLVLCPPGILHAWRSDSSMQVPEKASGIVLRFEPATLPASLLKLPEMAGLNSFEKTIASPLEFTVSDRERLRARLRSIDRAQGALRVARFFVALELVASFEYTQISEQHDVIGRSSPREHARTELLRRFVGDRFREPVTRKEAADLVGLDEASFSRFFHKAMGTTFVDYLSSLRVRHAAALLGDRRDISLQEVAIRSGFGSLSSLHRQFKKRLGTTPDSYRKAANSEILGP